MEDIEKIAGVKQATISSHKTPRLVDAAQVISCYKIEVKTMSQILSKYVSICLLICAFLAGCTGGVTPIAREYQEKFGMQIPADLWQVDETQEGSQYGLLTHRTLKGCQVRVMVSDPGLVYGFTPDEKTSTFEEFTTAETRMDLRKLKDTNGDLKYTFFEVFDTSNPGGYRLAYFLVEAEGNPEQCLESVQTLLLTLKPELFPRIGTAQG